MKKFDAEQTEHIEDLIDVRDANLARAEMKIDTLRAQTALQTIENNELLKNLEAASEEIARLKEELQARGNGVLVPSDKLKAMQNQILVAREALQQAHDICSEAGELYLALLIKEAMAAMEGE